MIWVLLGLLIVSLIFLPGLWVRMVLRRHDRDRSDLPGTGGELARHLLDESGLASVQIEATEIGDHYDSDAKVVRLTRRIMEGRSISAVAVAAHEVGHAIQDRDGYAGLRYRSRILTTARAIQTLGMFVMLLAPALAVVARSPAAAALPLVAGVLVRGAAVVAAIAALPSEFDASFGKALPMLRNGGYLENRDVAAASSVLRAAALTYVANAAVQVIFAGRGGMRF